MWAAKLATVVNGVRTHEATVGDGKQAHIATVGDGKKAHGRTLHNSLHNGERTREKSLRIQSAIGRAILQACWEGRLAQHFNDSQRPPKWLQLLFANRSLSGCLLNKNHGNISILSLWLCLLSYCWLIVFLCPIHDVRPLISEHVHVCANLKIYFK